MLDIFERNKAERVALSLIDQSTTWQAAVRLVQGLEGHLVLVRVLHQRKQTLQQMRTNTTLREIQPGYASF